MKRGLSFKDDFGLEDRPSFKRSLSGSVSDDLNYSSFLHLTSSIDRKGYIQFRRDSFSPWVFGFFLTAATLTTILRDLYLWTDTIDITHSAYYFAFCGPILSLFFGLFPGWILFTTHLLSRSKKSMLLMQLHSFFSKWMTLMEYCLGVLLPLGIAFRLLAYSMAPECTHTPDTWRPKLCNTERQGDLLPQGELFRVILIPFMLQTLCHCPQSTAVFLSWLISLIAIIACLIITSAQASSPAIIYVLAIGVVLYEIERREIDIYIHTRRLSKSEALTSMQMVERQKSSFQAVTLRQVVANVSHDLLSPIQALDMGFESLYLILEDNCGSVEKLSEEALESLRLASSFNASEQSIEAQALRFGLKKPHFGLSKGMIKKSLKEKIEDNPCRRMDNEIKFVQENIQSSLDSAGSQMKMGRDLLQSMRGSLTFMSMIINRSLDVSKVHGGLQLVPNCEFFEFEESINKSVRCISDMQSDVPIVILPLPRDIAPIVYTDKRWFEGNLLCVLSNAVKFSARETGDVVLLEVKSSTEMVNASPVPMLTVTITDCGPVVPESARAKFFLPAEQSNRQQMGGSGMGLFTLSKRVEALGGRVGARRRDDDSSKTGTSVWFTVPCSRVKKPTRAVADDCDDITGQDESGQTAGRPRAPSLRNASSDDETEVRNKLSCAVHPAESRFSLANVVSLVPSNLSSTYKSLLATARSSKRTTMSTSDTSEPPTDGSNDHHEADVSFSSRVYQHMKTKASQKFASSKLASITPVDRESEGEGRSSNKSDSKGPNEHEYERFSPLASADGRTLSGRAKDKYAPVPASSQKGFAVGYTSFSGDEKADEAAATSASTAPVSALPVSVARVSLKAIAVTAPVQREPLDGSISSRRAIFGSTKGPLTVHPNFSHSKDETVKADVSRSLSLTESPKASGRASSGDSPSFPVAKASTVDSPQPNTGRVTMSESPAATGRGYQTDSPLVMEQEMAARSSPVEFSSTAATTIPPALATPAATPAATHAVVPKPKAKALHVLVVDDSISIMKIMKMSLERAGHTVQSAVNGKIALDLMKEHVYDVVLMDLQMPVMGGIECCVEFRAFELVQLTKARTRSHRQLIIGMSANGEASTRQGALNADMDEFIAKPFSLSSMMTALQYLDPEISN